MTSTTIDKPWATELALYILNDGNLYRQITRPWVLNLARKKVKGTYDRTLAIKGLDYLVKEGIKRYRKDFGVSQPVMTTAFNPATRKHAAEYILNYLQDEIEYTTKQMRALKASGKPWTMQDR